MNPVMVTETAQAMSTAIAPVFLISGIGMLLNGMSLRYGRVIDRTRQLLRDGDRLYRRDITADHLNFELLSLYRRAHTLRLTIILSAVSIFCVVITIFALFAGLMFKVAAPYIAEAFFMLALLLLIASLILFIRDFAISLHLIKHDIFARAPQDFPKAELEASDGGLPAP